MNINKISCVVAVLVIAFSSCKKDQDLNVETENYKGVFVVNEGGFAKSNGSIGLYKPGEKTYFDAFKKANGLPLGDIVQSMSLIGSNFYIVVNNSNKIEVVSQSEFKTVASIITPSPRYVLPVSASKAYVSNFYNNSVKVLDLNTKSITKSIEIFHNSDQMALLNKKVYVGTFENKLMVINSLNDSLVDSVSTASGLSKIVNVGSAKLAILCTGVVDWNNGSIIENGKIQILNDSSKIENSYALSSGSYGGSMVYSSNTGLLYFSLGNNVIYKMSLSGVITEFKTLDAGRNVYGLTYNSTNSSIYVTDAGDFNSAGKVMVYDLSGNKTLEFDAGIAPNSVLVSE
jgi:DNA-binding beta-propeller fold protein YncE